MRKRFSLLFVILLFGCNRDVVLVTPTAFTDSTPNATMFATLSTETAVPPTNTPTTLLSPPSTEASPLPDMFQSHHQLGVNWWCDAFSAEYVGPMRTGELPLLVHERYGPNQGISVVNARTGQTVVEMPFGTEDFYNYDMSGDSLYMVNYDDESSLVHTQAWDLRHGELLWETTVNQPFYSVNYALEKGLLLIGHHYRTEPNNTLVLLDSADGQPLWEIHEGKDCFVSSFDIQVINDQLYIKCEEDLWVIDPNSGEIVTTLKTPTDYFSSFTAAGSLAYMIRQVWEEEQVGDRTYEAEHHYLEARDIGTYDVLWSLDIPLDVYSLATIDGDVIYRSGNQVFRLARESGDKVWQTAITGDVPFNLLLSEKWLLVGSGVGYLHLLDAETGELMWEQDVWATIEPRSVYVAPIALLDEAIIVNSGNEHLSLGIDGNSIWEQPTATPRPIPTITPTATPLPTFTLPADNELPSLPEAPEIWPEVILAFLNADSTNIDRLETLLDKWTTSEASTLGPRSFDLQAADLTSDGRKELLVLINGLYVDYPAGWAIVIQQNVNEYILAWAQPSITPEIVSLLDLNNDNSLDLVLGDTMSGVSQSYVTIIPIGWDGEAFVDLSFESIATTNVHLDEVRIENTTGDGRLEIVIRGGTYGSAGYGPTRTSTFTYTLTDEGYVLFSQTPDLPQDYYFFLVEANQRLVAGDLEFAITIYEDSLYSEDAIYDDYADHQRAFAEFQLVLAYLLLDNEAEASLWASSGNYPEQHYSEVKQIFWDIYQGSHDWVEAAEAARKRVRLAGFEKAQLVPWVGAANTPLGLEDILPCADCLQGNIGSQFGP